MSTQSPEQVSNQPKAAWRVRDQVTNRLSQLFGPIEDYEDSEAHESAVAWYDNYKPNVKEDFDHILKIAIGKCNEAKEHFDITDKKAEWCFGITTAGAAAILAFPEYLGLGFTAALPSIVLMLLGAYAAIRARIPHDIPSLFSVKAAIEIYESKGLHMFKAEQAASLHPVFVGITHVNKFKTDLVRISAELIIAAIVLLTFTKLLAVIGSLVMYLFSEAAVVTV